MIGPVIPSLSSELWTVLQNQIELNIDGYDLVESQNLKEFSHILSLESKFIRTKLPNLTG